jgi:hypothetical protein
VSRPRRPNGPVSPRELLRLALLATVAAVLGLLMHEAATSGLRAERDALRVELEAAGAHAERLGLELARAQSERQRAERLATILQAPGVVEIELEARDGRGRARLFFDRAGGRGLLQAQGLPPLAEGRVYALWLERAGGGPVAAGSFETNAEEEGALLFELAGETAAHTQPPADAGRSTIVAARVTVERAPPGQAPSGPVALAGSFGSDAAAAGGPPGGP